MLTPPIVLLTQPVRFEIPRQPHKNPNDLKKAALAATPPQDFQMDSLINQSPSDEPLRRKSTDDVSHSALKNSAHFARKPWKPASALKTFTHMQSLLVQSPSNEPLLRESTDNGAKSVSKNAAHFARKPRPKIAESAKPRKKSRGEVAKQMIHENGVSHLPRHTSFSSQRKQAPLVTHIADSKGKSNSSRKKQNKEGAEEATAPNPIKQHHHNFLLDNIVFVDGRNKTTQPFSQLLPRLTIQ